MTDSWLQENRRRWDECNPCPVYYPGTFLPDNRRFIGHEEKKLPKKPAPTPVPVEDLSECFECNTKVPISMIEHGMCRNCAAVYGM